MKMLCAVALIVFSVLPKGNAQAESNWVKVADGKSAETLVSTNSIHETNGIVTAWYMRNFADPMSLDASSRVYRSSKVLGYYDCAGHKVATAQWVTYEDENGLGKVVSNEKISAPEYSEDPSDATSKVILDFVCKYVKSHKTRSNKLPPPTKAS